MELIFVILPLALLIAGISVAAFLWAARTDQFADLDTPAVRMLQEEEGAKAGGTRDARRTDQSRPTSVHTAPGTTGPCPVGEPPRG